MTKYEEDMTNPVLFGPRPQSATFGEIVSAAGLTQLRLAETEKYAHVTYFFNGGRETVFEGEDRVLIPSNRSIATYDLAPEMRAAEITSAATEDIADRLHDVIVMNYANADMVGHTGVMDATISSVETLDVALGRLEKAVLDADGILAITSDHGNAEEKLDADGNALTAHTTNPVPLVIVSREPYLGPFANGKLGDVATTLLPLLGLEPSAPMTGGEPRARTCRPARLINRPKRLATAARRIVKRAGGPIDVAIVLGSGLADGVRTRIEGSAIAYAKLFAPTRSVAGHPGVAYVGAWAGKRVVAFAGRAHLYQGYDPLDVTYFVRLANACGARTIVLTNAAGGLDPAFRRGDLMSIRDHINLTGATPLDGASADPFLNMVDAYAPHLRARAKSAAGDVTLHEGVYAGLRGPQYETPAECEALRRLGAHAVGMSTVLETIAARSLGLDVLGLSLITNATSPTDDVSHADVLAASRDGAENVAGVIERLLALL